MVEIHTDGACSGNNVVPGKDKVAPGGWAAILIAKDEEGALRKKISVWGGSPNTSNQTKVLPAAIEGLKALEKPSVTLTLFTDSKYVSDGMTTWIENWKKKGWKGSNKKPIKNKELWQELDAVASEHNITWQWVKGHNGDPLNEEVDTLAVEACEEYKVNIDDENDPAESN